jgi:NAD(P)-dependent dehydrogenase (short-subunit alcohol dehydrogenase family)
VAGERLALSVFALSYQAMERSTSGALEGRVAIVTGGSRGIGLAVAGAILARGGRVAITGLSEANLDRARARLGADDRVEALRADVRRADEAATMVERTVARFGGLDILVNNAGVGRFAPAADMTVAQWHEVIDTNLSGVFYCCHAAIPHLRKRGGGWIVNVSSLAGKNAFVGGTAYCASKAGLNAFSEALMQEVRYDGIRVSYVMPGSVATEFGGRPGEETWKLTSEDVAQVVVDLLAHDRRSLPSRVEIRPSQPPRK